MILTHIFLPAMMLVICRSQQAPPHSTNVFGNEESVFGNVATSDSISNPSPSSNAELLDRYRQLTIKSLLKLPDSCKVHDFIQNLKHNLENDLDEEDMVKSSDMPKDHQQRYINTLLRVLEKQQSFDNDITLLFPNERITEKPKSALYYYVSVSMLLQDKEFDETISYMLYDKCCKNEINFLTSSVCMQNADDITTEKRNTVKKIKFHSWGGKRSDWTMDKRSSRNGETNVRMPTGVAMSKDLGPAKIVIRTPFRPWGGR